MTTRGEVSTMKSVVQSSCKYDIMSSMTRDDYQGGGIYNEIGGSVLLQV